MKFLFRQMIELIPAKNSDAKLISDIAIKTQLETFEKLNPTGLAKAYCDECLNPQIIENEINTPNSYYFLLKKSSELIGFLKLRTDNIEENQLAGPLAMELQRIYVLAAEKGQGFGKYLLNFSEKFAIDNGFKILWLGVWEHNLNAISFYTHNGYSKFAEHDFMYAGDNQTDFMMRKNLSD